MVRAAGAVLEPEDVADVVVDAIDREQFLILPHPEVLTFFQRKGLDYERWLAGMRRLQSRIDEWVVSDGLEDNSRYATVTSQGADRL